MRLKLKGNPNIHTKIKNAIEKYTGKDQQLKSLLGKLKDFDNVYIVGGFLRDLILGGGSKDIDFLYDGDLLFFFNELKSEMKCEYKYNSRFMTGVLEYEGRDFDFATTRCEKYPKPGVLPIVKHCPIESDFNRRDFTINALVWDIRNERLLDPLNGINDIYSRILRLTYVESFKDDPTRILRGIRFAGKYSLKIDSKTIKCYNDAVKKEYLFNISSGRIRRELDYIFRESSFKNIIKMAYNAGIIKCGKDRFNDFMEKIKSMDIKNEYLFNRDLAIAFCRKDCLLKKAYPGEHRRIMDMLRKDFKDIYSIFRNYREREFRIYLLDKGYTIQGTDEIMYKLKKISKMNLYELITKKHPEIKGNKLNRTIRNIVQTYLKGEFKELNNIKDYIDNMEV